MCRYAVVGAIFLLAGSAWAQSPSGATAPSPTSADAAKPVLAMEEPLPGDFWTYEVRDEISGKVTATRTNVVTEVSSSEISVRYNIAGKETDGLNVYDRSWNLKSSAPWKYRPHEGSGITSPLKVGANWSFAGDNVNGDNGNIWKQTGQSKVVGQETITTKAGTFDTFKIETVASRHPTKDPTRKVEITQQTWYAPAIDHWVKRILVTRADKHLVVNNTIELIEYGRKK
jgi:hypothetical protein